MKSVVVWLFIFLTFFYIVATNGYSDFSNAVTFRLILFIFAIVDALFVTFMVNKSKQKNLWQKILLILVIISFIAVTFAGYIYFLENYVLLTAYIS